MAHYHQNEAQYDQEGLIRSHVRFAEAAANGSRSTVRFLSFLFCFPSLGRGRELLSCVCVLQVEFLLENGAAIDAPGKGKQQFEQQQ
jgi:hypothetical protein